MAAVIRDIVDTQGVLFGEGSTGLNYTQLIKEGEMEKLGRGRGLVASLLRKNWAVRNFRLHEDKKVYYYDGTSPRGEFSIANGRIARVKKEDADGREYAFEITTADGEKVLVACETEFNMIDWINKLTLVASGRWALYRWTDLVAQYGKIELVPPQKIDVEIDEENLKVVMSADGYGPERMIEIVEEYLKELYAKIARFVAEDEEFSVLLRRKMFALRIRIIKCAESDTSKGYYRTAFNSDGELEIQFIKAWTNLNKLGEDLVHSISVGDDIPYVVAKSIRQRKPFLDAMLQSYEQLLGITGIQYDYCVKENMDAMVAANYDLSRFAEIMFQEHLTPLIQRLARFVGEYPQFKSSFAAKFAGKTIIIQRASDPSSCKHYYNSTFTAEGNLLIQYKSFWCNISEIGNDIGDYVNRFQHPQTLPPSSVLNSNMISLSTTPFTPDDSRVTSGSPRSILLDTSVINSNTSFANALARENAASISAVASNETNGVNPYLKVNAVAVSNGEGRVCIKFQVIVSNDQQFDEINYGEKLISFAGPDGQIIINKMMEIVPMERIRPSRCYQLYDATTNTPIYDDASLIIRDAQGSEREIFGYDSIIDVDELGEGVFTLSPVVFGYGRSTEMVIKYRELYNEETVRLFLNPANMASNDVRLVLTWGEEPRDLDFHITDSAGAHIYCFEKNSNSGMSLDVDVTCGGGPETVTFRRQNGIHYWVYVHHYSGEGTLASSQAKIQVYGISNLSTIYVPGDACCSYGSQEGYWNAFRIDGNGIATVVNTIVRDSSGSHTARKF